MALTVNLPQGNMTPTNAVIALLQPDASGNLLGSAANPLATQTSSLQTTPDLTLARFAISTATTTVLCAAVAAKKNRIYRVRLDVAGANVLTWLDAAGTYQIMNFPAAASLTYDFFTRPWFYNALVNTSISLTTSTTAAVNLLIEYTNAA